MDWSKLLEIKRLNTRLFWLVAAAGSAVLYVPEWTIIGTFLVPVKNSFGTYIALAVLISYCAIIINAADFLIRHLSRFLRRVWRNEEIVARLSRLDPIEQAILRELAIFEQSSVRLPIDNASVAGLFDAGIIVPVGLFGRHSPHGMMIPFRISPTAERLCTPDVLGIPSIYYSSASGQRRLNSIGEQWVQENRAFDLF